MVEGIEKDMKNNTRRMFGLGISVVIVLLLVVFVIYVSYLVINNIYNDPILKVNKKTANYISFLFEDNNDHIIEIKNPKIKLPEVRENCTAVWHQYVIRCEERDRLIEYLDEKGIGTIIHYPIPPHLAEAYSYLGYKEGAFPITEKCAKTVLSIPMYCGMTAEEQTQVIEALNAFE